VTAERDLREGGQLDVKVHRTGADPQQMAMTITAVESPQRLQ
jgi:hypothetical protein